MLPPVRSVNQATANITIASTLRGKLVHVAAQPAWAQLYGVMCLQAACPAGLPFSAGCASAAAEQAGAWQVNVTVVASGFATGNAATTFTGQCCNCCGPLVAAFTLFFFLAVAAASSAGVTSKDILGGRQLLVSPPQGHNCSLQVNCTACPQTAGTSASESVSTNTSVEATIAGDWHIRTCCWLWGSRETCSDVHSLGARMLIGGSNPVFNCSCMLQ